MWLYSLYNQMLTCNEGVLFASRISDEDNIYNNVRAW